MVQQERCPCQQTADECLPETRMRNLWHIAATFKEGEHRIDLEGETCGESDHEPWQSPRDGQAWLRMR